jgi:hypothetical protein
VGQGSTCRGNHGKGDPRQAEGGKRLATTITNIEGGTECGAENRMARQGWHNTNDPGPWTSPPVPLPCPDVGARLVLIPLSR